MHSCGNPVDGGDVDVVVVIGGVVFVVVVDGGGGGAEVVVGVVFVVVVDGGGGVGVCDGCFDLSQQNFLSALLQIRLLSLAKIVLYSELVFPFSAPTFLKSSSFDLYETQLSLGRQE